VRFHWSITRSSSTRCTRSDTAAYHRPVRTIKRVLMAIGVVFGAVVYLWVAAVRALPRVKRRKEKLRARRYGS